MSNLMSGPDKKLIDTTTELHAKRDEAAIPAELVEDSEVMEQSMTSELSEKLGAKVLAKTTTVATIASQRRVVDVRESGEEAASPDVAK